MAHQVTKRFRKGVFCEQVNNGEVTLFRGSTDYLNRGPYVLFTIILSRFCVWYTVKTRHLLTI